MDVVWWSLLLLLLTTCASTCLQHSHNHAISGPVVLKAIDGLPGGGLWEGAPFCDGVLSL